MTLRAVVWKGAPGAWVCDTYHTEEFRHEKSVVWRAYSLRGWNTQRFLTHAEAIAYAHRITHQEQE